MMRFVIPFLLVAFFSSPAHAFTADTGMFDGLEFVADTDVAGTEGRTLSLCHEIQELKILGFTVSSSVTGYALANDGCTKTAARKLSQDQLKAAQSFDLIDPTLPLVPANSFERSLQNVTIWVAISLAMIAVIIRRMKSLSGKDTRRPMRKKAADRILQVMCYVGKCDGIVAAKEISIIGETAQRLTRRPVKSSEVIHITDHISMDLTPQDFINFGKGLRDSEKEILMQGAFYVALASGRMLPAEHQFVTDLAYAIGMPGEDFRRVMNVTLLDLDLHPPS
jgi:hypothetical protein